MNNQLNEGELLVNRVKLLMGYDMSKTLNENTQNIFEQPDSRFMSPEERVILARGEEQLKQRQAQEESEKYPNWCRYPDKALGIPKNPEGVEGEDAILVDPKSGKRFCYYPSPSNQKMGDTSSIPIPEDSAIAFWDIKGISDTVNKFSKDYPKDDKKLLISNLTKVLPIGTVRQFVVGEEDYIGYLSRTEGTNLWTFGYYRNLKTRKPYTPPEWVDKRSDYQRFVDEWGLMIQLVAAGATIVAGFFTFGSTWGISNLLLIEIALEIGIGSAVAFREFEKGNNVSGTFSIVTGMLPMLKLTKWFRGIDGEQFKILSDAIANSGLNKSSTVKDYVAFYNGLTPDGQKIMDKLLTNDKITREALWADIKMSMDAELPKIVDNMIPKLVAKNPKLLKDIKFFERLWVRELSTNVGAFVGFGLLEMFAGDKLNNTQKQSIKQVYQYIPDSLKKELTYNLLNNQDKIGEITEHFQPSIDNQVKGYEKLMNTTIKYSFKKAGADYVELPDDKTIGDDMSDEIVDVKDLKIYRKKGWKPISELNDDEYYDSIKMINNEMWVKLKKISDDNIEKTINDTIK
jgi:hypothetical protein